MAVPVDFIHGLQWRDIPVSAQHAARRSLLDTVGVAISATVTPTAKIICDHAASQFGAGDREGASLWRDGRIVSPAGAALANGMTIDSIDAHDGNKPTKGHVGCGVLPALVAMAQATGQLDTEEFLASMVMGYEIGTRAGTALHATVSDYHTSGAWIALAAAAIGARYLKLNAEQTRHALGIAEYHGPRSQMMRCIDHPTMLKDGSGWGAMAGISAAYLARGGFTGAPAITMEEDRAEHFWNDLGSRWCMEEHYIKLYPCCRWAQPPVEAIFALKQEHGFGASDVEATGIDTFHEAARLATHHPATSDEAQYSLPYAVGVALAHDGFTAEHLSDSALNNGNMAALRNGITIGETDEFNTAFPMKRYARATLRLKDGRELVSPVMEAIGDPENPVNDDVLRQKFVDFTTPVLGEAEANSTLRTVWETESATTVEPLIAALIQS